MPKRPAGESLKQYEAFEYWFWQESRSFRVVAENFKVSEAIVRQWCAKYSWEERAQERASKIMAEMADRNNAKAQTVRDKLLKISDAVLTSFGSRLLTDPEQRGKNVTQYEPNAVDAARWAQLQLLLTGGATNRTEHTVGAGFIDAFLAMVASVLRREVPRCCPHCKTDLGLGEKIAAQLVEASARLVAEQARTSGAAAPEPKTLGFARDDAPDDAGPTA